MKKLTTLSLLFFLLLSACSKKNDDRPEPVKYGPLTDFLYLPTKDAVWKIHLQGAYYTDVPSPGGVLYGYDTAVHFYYEVRATGIDTVVGSLRYYKYVCDQEVVYSKAPEYNQQSKGEVFYLREDTARQAVYWGYPSTPQYDVIAVDFSTGNVGDRATEIPASWPASHIAKIDSMKINGQLAKMWNVTYDHDKYASSFYKAYGVGGQMGFLGNISWGSAQPVSLDFNYKGSRNHFDFPLYNP